MTIRTDTSITCDSPVKAHGKLLACGEVIEAEVLETSSLIGVPLREAQLPDGVIVGAVVRRDKVLIPRGDTVIRAHDLVVIFAATHAVKKIEKLFAVKLEFF